MLTGPPDWRVISPWVRNSGGSPTRRCRSDDLDCTSARSRSPSVRSAAWYCAAAKSAAGSLGATAVRSGAAATLGARWTAGVGAAGAAGAAAGAAVGADARGAFLGAGAAAGAGGAGGGAEGAVATASAGADRPFGDTTAV